MLKFAIEIGPTRSTLKEVPDDPGEGWAELAQHLLRSARDRDRLRQMALENQGWKIHRIWSTDWFKNRNGEIERLLNRVRTLENQ